MNRFISMIGFIMGALILSGCGDNIPPHENNDKGPIVEGVTVKKVMPVEVTEYYTTSGSIRSKNTAAVASRIMGEVKDIKVIAGDSVRKGDVLLLIRSPDMEARVNAAREAIREADKGLNMGKENLVLMEKTFERFKKLHEEKAVTEQEFDEVTSKRQIAMLDYEMRQKRLGRTKSALSEAEAFRDYSIITSPINGIVAEKNVEKGSMTAPGMPLFIIEEPVYRVEVFVDEGMISFLKPGMPVEILIDALDIKSTGKIGEIVHQVDPTSRTIKVKIDMDNSIKSLHGGFYATVRFPVDIYSKLLINKDAVVTRGELRGVYAVNEDGLISLRLVKTGKKNDGMVEILSGLDKGDQIIVYGVEKAVDGGRVR